MKSTSTKVQIFSDYTYGQINQSDLVDNNQINAMLQMKQYPRELLSDEYKNFQNMIYGDLLYKRNYIQ